MRQLEPGLVDAGAVRKGPAPVLKALATASADFLAPAALVALIFSGVFKASPALDWVPIDLTLASASTVALGLFLHAVTLRARVSLAAVVFASVMSLGFLIGQPNPYTLTAQLSVVLSMLSAWGAYWLIRRSHQRAVWVWLHVAAGVGILLLAVAPGTTGRLAITESGTIAAGQLTGVSIVVLLALLLHRGIQNPVAVMVTVAGVFVLTRALFETGSRGPAAFVAVATIAVAVLVRRPGRFKRTVATGLMVGAGWWVLNTVAGGGAERLRLALSGRIDNTATRDVIWQQALAAIPDHPEGIGWGNFWSVLTAGAELDSGYRQYPHNIILETFLEGGWLAGTAVTAFILVGLRRLLMSAVDAYGAAIFGIAVFFVLCAMVSGSVGDNRAMFAAVALGFVPGAQRADVESPAATNRLTRPRPHRSVTTPGTSSRAPEPRRET